MGFLMRVDPFAKFLYSYKCEQPPQMSSLSGNHIIYSITIEDRPFITNKNLFFAPLLQTITGPCIFIAGTGITVHFFAEIDADDIVGALPVKRFLIIRCNNIVRRRDYIIARNFFRIVVEPFERKNLCHFPLVALITWSILKNLPSFYISISAYQIQ